MKTLSFVLILFCLPILLNAQKACSVPGCSGANSINIGTGIDADGNFLPAGEVDPHWQLMNYPELNTSNNCTLPDVTIPNANVIPLREWPSNSGNTASWLNINGCEIPASCGIISPSTTNTFGCNNLSSDQPWLFRRYFCVCHTSGVSIQANIRIDDEGTFAIYNMADDSPILSEIDLSCMNSDCIINEPLILPAGSYYIEVGLVNDNGNSSWQYNYAGLAITGSISTINDPGALVDNGAQCCSNTAAITVQKVLETQKCNGQTDIGEQLGTGWSFNLLDENGNAVQSGTTNEFGELIFSGLSAGAYTIVEQLQEGFIPESPAGGVQQVVLENGGVQQVTFYNCPRVLTPGETCCSKLPNLVTNYDFNQGNNSFNSQYAYDNSIPGPSSLLPGEYALLYGDEAAAICQDWQLCSDNGDMLVVNGQTGQDGNNLVWEQTITNLEPWKEYLFCAKMKNLPQCCFDVNPKVDIKFSVPGHDLLDVIVNEDPSDPCQWKTVETRFFVEDSYDEITIQIWLDETPLGDGNDLAIDDIAFKQLPFIDEQYIKFSYDITEAINGFYNVTVTALEEYPDDLGQCDAAWTVVSVYNEEEYPIYNDPAWWVEPNYIYSTDFPGYDGTVPNAPTVLGNAQPGLFDLDEVTYLFKRGAYCECYGWREWSITLNSSARSRYIYVRDGKTNALLERIPKKRLRVKP